MAFKARGSKQLNASDCMVGVFKNSIAALIGG